MARSKRGGMKMDMKKQNEKMRKLLQEIFDADDNEEIDPAERCHLSWWAWDMTKEILESDICE